MLVTHGASSSLSAPAAPPRLYQKRRAAQFLREALHDHAGLDVAIDRVRIDRYWPLRDGGVAWEWSARANAGPRFSLYALTGAACGQTRPALNGACRLTADGLRGLSVLLPAWDTAAFSPDCDASLPFLPEALDSAVMAGKLQAAGCLRTADLPADEPITTRLLGYRAGKRATILYQTPGRALVVGKVFRHNRAPALAQAHVAVNEQLALRRSPLRVPAPIGLLPQLHMVLFQPARTAAGAKASGTLELRPVLEAMADFHALRIEGLRRHGVGDELAVVDRWERMLARLAPNKHARLAELRDLLHERSAAAEDGATCTIHRDLHDGQIAASADGWTLFDLDTAAIGSPCVDLGNAYAHAVLADLRQGRSMVAACAAWPDLLNAYRRRHGAVDPAAAAFYAASSLARVGAVHGLRTLTSGAAPKLWLRARSLLQAPRGRGTGRRLRLSPTQKGGGP